VNRETGTRRDETTTGNEAETPSPDLDALNKLLRYAWTEAVSQRRDMTAALIVNAIAALSDQDTALASPVMVPSDSHTRH
jgi:hypothetical protein